MGLRNTGIITISVGLYNYFSRRRPALGLSFPSQASARAIVFPVAGQRSGYLSRRRPALGRFRLALPSQASARAMFPVAGQRSGCYPASARFAYRKPAPGLLSFPSQASARAVLPVAGQRSGYRLSRRRPALGFMILAIFGIGVHDFGHFWHWGSRFGPFLALGFMILVIFGHFWHWGS